MHAKKHKGDIGLAKAIARLTELGWHCCIPLTEHASYDLIIERAGIMYRVQVRYTSEIQGVLPVKLRSCWSDRNGLHFRKRQARDYDVLAVYAPGIDRVFFVKAADFPNGNTLILRLEPPRNGQSNGVRMADAFTDLD